MQSVALSTGVTLPYIEQGDPAGVPLLLLHAVADSARFFEPLLASLPSSVHAFAPSQRGHGGADAPPAGYEVEQFAADAAAFLDAVGVGAAVIAGQSSGGYVAQRFALDRPERTSGLVLMGSPYSLRDKPGVHELLRELAGLRDPLDPAWVREFVDGTSGELPEAVVESLVSEALKAPAHVWRATFDGLARAEPPTTTGTIAMPTLILWGESDDLTGLADQRALVAAIPGARLVRYEHTGHAVAVERPERAAGDLAAFAQEAMVKARLRP